MKAKNEFVFIDGLEYYKISDTQNFNPFFIQVASASDIWLFMSSKGGVTAGRRNSSESVFPYETDDKLHFSYETGSKTLIKALGQFWQPFEQNAVNKYSITQNIYKGVLGNSVMMEEINHDLGLKFSYCYESSEKFGIVKTSRLTNLKGKTVKAEVLDALVNMLPYGVNNALQMESSTLVDAYKASELLGDKIAVYSLTTQINDTPNPIEVLKANVAFTTLKDCQVYLNSDIVNDFKKGDISNTTKECYGKKCGYYVVWDKTIEGQDTVKYSVLVDVGFDHAQLAKLEKFVENKNFSEIEDDIKIGNASLLKIVKDSDGVQDTGDKTATAHHYLNTLYNVMRGGTFENSYNFEPAEFRKFVALRDIKASKNEEFFKDIQNFKTVSELKEYCKNDSLMYRLALEYMPLSFSRRHGDPSRPWNKFNIQLKDENGKKISSYEGNWRDIYQNWEALGLSYPAFYENMVAKFVNASTADGFNPYRISTTGIDWEKPEPDNPFGGYGYWGDHQIIYLLRLLKGLNNHYPEKLKELLSHEVFSYANVPYIIVSYDKILQNSKDTITFDFEKDAKIESLIPSMGNDARLILKDGEVYTVSLTEKLIVPLLSKLSNLLVGGGIWMNTQRPEWNDANNAIVGIGLSMVTVYHVKAYIEFLSSVLENETGEFSISCEVAKWLKDTCAVFADYADNYKDNEKALLDELGYIFSEYRTNMYNNGFDTKTKLTADEIKSWIKVAEKAIDYTIDVNSGDVYSTYNLLNDDFTVSKMRSMLEGQSAIIGSGSLNADKVCGLLASIKDELYNEKMKCHTLYPIKTTRRFAEKNAIKTEIGVIENITVKDINGVIHFESGISTCDELLKRCQNLTPELTKTLTEEFENQFTHKKFTGRSEVMYRFEGIGCVYWHQNAKLALAVLEAVQKAHKNGEDATEIYEVYHNLMQGFIYRKTPEEACAISIEPYSHTSFNGKSEQPGMTGQVKESILMRRIELGVEVANGQIYFDKWFVPANEFKDSGEFTFSIYSIPVKYIKSDEDKVVVSFTCGNNKIYSDCIIDNEVSAMIFDRSEKVTSIEVFTKV
ncbi:MAG: hypothetical protein R3Y35_05115 [Clostridia bacterium]